MAGRQRHRDRHAVGGGRRGPGLPPLLLPTCLCDALLFLGFAADAAADRKDGVTPSVPPPAAADGATRVGGGGGGAASGGGSSGGLVLHRPLCDRPVTSCLLSTAPRPCTTVACHAEVAVLIFPLLALIIGILLQPLVGLLRLPYTLLLLLAGALLGALGCATSPGMLTRSLRRWVHLEPPTIFFFVFLAPLIFEAAYTTGWHVLAPPDRDARFRHCHPAGVCRGDVPAVRPAVGVLVVVVGADVWGDALSDGPHLRDDHIQVSRRIGTAQRPGRRGVVAQR